MQNIFADFEHPTLTGIKSVLSCFSGLVRHSTTTRFVA